MPESRASDDALAAFTDRLLAGESPPAEDVPAELAETVRQLYAVIAPEQPVSPGLRARLADRLRIDWEIQRRSPVRWWRNRQVQRVLAVVAMLVIVLAATIALSVGRAEQQPALEGTVGGVTAGVLVVLAALGGLSVIAVLVARWRRRH